MRKNAANPNELCEAALKFMSRANEYSMNSMYSNKQPQFIDPSLIEDLEIVIARLKRNQTAEQARYAAKISSASITSNQ